MKKISRLTLIGLLIIFILAALVRFYNFSERVTFGPEQAVSLITSGDYLKVKPSLLGEPNMQRFTVSGHQLFHPPVFNYSLAPLLVIFDYNPLPITAYFVLLNLCTGLVIYWVTRSINSKPAAVFAAILFLFNSTMVYHSLFIWNQNYIPLISSFLIYLLYLLYKKRTRLVYPLLMGVLVGVAIGLEFLYVFTLTLALLLIIYLSKRKIPAAFSYLAGLIIANMPTIIFDLKHGYYFVFTYWQYFLDTLQNPGQNHISYYHFLQFWPVLTILGGVVLAYFYQRSRLTALGLIAAYLLATMLYGGMWFDRPSGMNDGLTLAKVEQAAATIANDKPGKFNVATMMDFDSRAHPLRYFLRFKYNLEPEGVEKYKDLDRLYVFAQSDYDFNRALAFEINSYRPFKVEVLKTIDQKYTVFKLTKQ